MQITYGPVSPIIAQPDRYRIKHYDFVVRNIPPAQLWTYTSPDRLAACSASTSPIRRSRSIRPFRCRIGVCRSLARREPIRRPCCPWVKDLRRIISSGERKAIETAAILAEAAGVAPEVDEVMHENDRSATGFLSPPAFETAADWFFAHPQDSYKGWERAVDAQARIVEAVARALADHDPQTADCLCRPWRRRHAAEMPYHRQSDCTRPRSATRRWQSFLFYPWPILADCRLTCDWTAMELWQGERV